MLVEKNVIGQPFPLVHERGRDIATEYWRIFIHHNGTEDLDTERQSYHINPVIFDSVWHCVYVALRVRVRNKNAQLKKMYLPL